jgi:hypothetical protein
VIETVRGVEEFDSRDRALVWRVTGGKHRYLIDQAQVLVPDAIEAFAQAAAMRCSPIRSTDPDTALAALQARHAALKARVQAWGDCRDGLEIWARQGIAAPSDCPARHRCLPAPPPTGACHEHAAAALLDALFPHGHAIAVNDSVLTGTATTEDGDGRDRHHRPHRGRRRPCTGWPKPCWPAPPHTRSGRS